MTGERLGRRRAAVEAADGEPQRSCVACRGGRPQRLLLRLRRTPDGFVEADPRREGRGRGAYLCPAERCLAEAVKRGRWTQVFHAPTILRPETIERVRALVMAEGRAPLTGRPDRPGVTDGGGPLAGACGKSVEGRW